MSTVIKVENLSKRYYLSHRQKENFPTLRDAITRTAANFGKRLLHPMRASSGVPLGGLDSTEEFWALKDVSFEVKQGDRIGIIGRNGAGKSTLLKILSRITEPTSGRALIKGRVASLLEVGTGFHPELTGRENVFLNGAILGMTKAEIRCKFDKIVAFAEIEKFLDTPVKRYSSGMYVRLAFAVAAYLEPEILIVDEVLAVGDAQFQKKCLGKMEDVGKEGRTVLFVSHNMGAIQKLCTGGIYLDGGRVYRAVDVDEAISRYLDLSTADCVYYENESPDSCRRANVLHVELLDEFGARRHHVKTSDRIVVRFSYQILNPVPTLQMGVCLLEEDGTQIFATAPQDANVPVPQEAGNYVSTVHLPEDMLMPHRYRIKVVIWDPAEGMIHQVDCITFIPNETMSLYNSTPGGRLGLITLRCPWQTNRTA